MDEYLVLASPIRYSPPFVFQTASTLPSGFAVRFESSETSSEVSGVSFPGKSVRTEVPENEFVKYARGGQEGSLEIHSKSRSTDGNGFIERHPAVSQRRFPEGYCKYATTEPVDVFIG